MVNRRGWAALSWLFVGMLFLWHCGPEKECAFSSDCNSGFICLDGKCKEEARFTCKSDSDCEATQRCLQGLCQLRPTVTDAGESTSPDQSGLETKPETSVPKEETGKEPVVEKTLEPDGAPPPNITCVSDKECRPNGVCRVQVKNNEIVRKCGTLDGKVLGEACTTGTDCSSGLCHNKICIAVCLAHRHCPLTHYCGDVNFVDKTKTRGCIKGGRNGCAGDLDCQGGAVCQADFDTSANRVITTCRKPVKEDKESIGTTCTPGDFPGVCASHVCDPVVKKCLEICQPGIPCQTSGYECQPYPFLQGTLSICYPKPKSCQKPADCAAGTTCSAVPVEGGKAVVTCLRDRAAQPKQVGDACDPKKRDAGECSTGLCLPSAIGAGDGICTATCEQDSDCSGTPNTPVCGKVSLRNGALVSACIKKNAPCSSDAMCPSSEPFCTFGLSEGKPVIRCEKAGSRTKKVGEACNSSLGVGNACQNRLCVRGLNVCAAYCQDDAECGKDQQCRQIYVGEYTKIRACVPSTETICQHAKACIYPEACKADIDTTSGTDRIIGKCRGGFGGGFEAFCSTSAPGQPSNDCKTAICNEEVRACTELCRTDADCPLGRCRERTFRGYKIKACDIGCLVAKDCGPNQRCSAVYFQNRLSFRCREEDKTKKALGESCDPSKVLDEQCASGFCGYYTRTCTAPCKADSDCGSNQACANTFVRVTLGRLEPSKGCVPKTGSCENNGDCANNVRCYLRTQGSNVLKDCAPSLPGLKNDGEACDPAKSVPGDCQSGACEPVAKMCTRICKEDADCNGFNTLIKCKAISFGGVSHRVCSK